MTVAAADEIMALRKETSRLRRDLGKEKAENHKLKQQAVEMQRDFEVGATLLVLRHRAPLIRRGSHCICFDAGQDPAIRIHFSRCCCGTSGGHRGGK